MCLQGLRKIDTNFRSRLGEIDLIMLDKSTLVFVEVRFRKSATYGGAAESVNINKQKKIIKCAEYYLSKKKCWHYETRFDVIAISPSQKKPEENTIHWLKSAFTC